MGEVRGVLLWAEKSIFLLEASEASPSRPFEKCSVSVKTLTWLELLASDRAKAKKKCEVSVRK
jgi:hypothetical protein